MRKLIVLLAALAALVGLAAPVSASVRPAASGDLCLYSYSSFCVVTNGPGNDVNISDMRTPTDFQLDPADACVGTPFGYQVYYNDGVGCPFDGGSNLNAMFNGYDIYYLSDGGNCLTASTTAPYAVMKSCSTHGPYQEWVPVFTTGGPGPTWWISVGMSDHMYYIGGPAGQPYGLGTNCNTDGCEAGANHDVENGGAYVTWG